MSDAPPTTETGDSTTDNGTDDSAADPAAELERLRADNERLLREARKHEDRAKANRDAAKELEQLRSQQMTEQERAVADAVAKAERDAAERYGARLVATEVKLAAADRNLDVDALLEGLDVGRFIDDDGEPDVAAIRKWIEKLAPASNEGSDEPGRLPVPPLGQGAGQTLPLNGSPLLDALKSAVGAR